MYEMICILQSQQRILNMCVGLFDTDMDATCGIVFRHHLETHPMLEHFFCDKLLILQVMNECYDV